MRLNDGLRGKYMVIKADTGELVKNCFVLRPDRDPAAVTALRAYAEATDNETLAADIINWVGAERNDPLTLNDLRQIGREPVYIQFKHYPVQDECGGWDVIAFTDSEFLVTYIYGHLALELYGKSWLAYKKQDENQRARNMPWNDDGSCPVCGEYDNRDPFGSKVCPNCGAEMD